MVPFSDFADKTNICFGCRWCQQASSFLLRLNGVDILRIQPTYVGPTYTWYHREATTRKNLFFSRDAIIQRLSLSLFIKIICHLLGLHSFLLFFSFPSRLFHSFFSLLLLFSGCQLTRKASRDPSGLISCTLVFESIRGEFLRLFGHDNVD